MKIKKKKIKKECTYQWSIVSSWPNILKISNGKFIFKQQGFPFNCKFLKFLKLLKISNDLKFWKEFPVRSRNCKLVIADRDKRDPSVLQGKKDRIKIFVMNMAIRQKIDPKILN